MSDLQSQIYIAMSDLQSQIYTAMSDLQSQILVKIYWICSYEELIAKRKTLWLIYMKFWVQLKIIVITCNSCSMFRPGQMQTKLVEKFQM